MAEPVLAVNARDGDRVRRGQLLATLETDDLVASLTSAHQVAAEDEARLAATIGAAGQTFAQDEAAVRNAAAALTQARATLAGTLHDLARAEQLVHAGYPADADARPRTDRGRERPSGGRRRRPTGW